jgi:hypothetical protein
VGGNGITAKGGIAAMWQKCELERERTAVKGVENPNVDSGRQNSGRDASRRGQNGKADIT